MNEQQCQECSSKDCVCLECKGFLLADECVQKECPIDADFCTFFDGSDIFKGVL